MQDELYEIKVGKDIPTGKECIDKVLETFGEVKTRYESMDTKIVNLDYEMSDLLHKLELSPEIHKLILSIETDKTILNGLQYEIKEKVEQKNLLHSNKDKRSTNKVKKLQDKIDKQEILANALKDSIDTKLFFMDFKRNRVERRVMKSSKTELECIYKYVISKGGEITTNNLMAVREQTEVISDSLTHRTYRPRIRQDIGELINVNSIQDMKDIGYDIKVDLK